MLVLDASLTLSWYFPDEQTDAANALLMQIADQGAIVPTLWHLEVGNAFQTAIRRGRCDAAYRDQALAELRELPITVDADTLHHAWKDTLALSEKFGLSLYDATYLELAQRRGLMLATLDGKLMRAASVLGLSQTEN